MGKSQEKCVGVPCVGFENYRITASGKVWSVKRQKFLKPWVDGRGYSQVALRKGNKYHRKLVHRLAAEALIPNPQKLPWVVHKSTNLANNNINNLKWSN